MSKKRIYILISIIIIIAITIGGYLIFQQGNRERILPTNESEYKTFDPFGTSTSLINTDEIIKNTPVKESTNFYRITDFAISGASFFNDTKITKNSLGENQTETYPSLRYTRRINGHIYNYNIGQKTANIISDTTIPAIYESIFSGDANSVAYRFLSSDNKTINTFISTIGTNNSTFLPTNIIDITRSPDKNKLFYLLKNEDGVLGIIKNFRNEGIQQVWDSPYTEWISSWTNQDSIYLTTKASHNSDGYLFSLNISNGALKKIIGEVDGLTTLPSVNGGKILYSQSTQNGPLLNILDVEKNETIKIELYGLPEKCVWSNNNLYIYCAIPNNIKTSVLPDSWYQGIVSFEDKFVKIDSNSGIYETLFNSESMTPVDAVNLFLSENERQLFLTNKKDYTLWSLILN